MSALVNSGPWQLVPSGGWLPPKTNSQHYIVDFSHSGWILAVVNNPGLSQVDAETNGRLMAKAPEMRDRLVQVRNALMGASFSTGSQAHELFVGIIDILSYIDGQAS